MKTVIQQVPLKDLRSNSFQDVDLFQGIDIDTLQGIEAAWAPLFNAAPSEDRQEDAHWDWTKKAYVAVSNPMSYEIFGIEAEGQTQGMMLVVKGGTKCFSRHADHPRKPLVYVDFLATAPWNRPSMTATPTFKGVGRILLMTAVTLSYDEEFAGRVGLHALPGAESFYRDRMGMTDFDGDPDYHNLRYFELSEQQAAGLTGRAPQTKKGG